jgi:hypothetical protein
MSLDDKFSPIRETFYEAVGNIFKLMAGPLGYPENPGMSTIYQMPSDLYTRSTFINNLPKHQTYWPPIQKPETWFEMIFGPSPKTDTVVRTFYENKGEGFYNFYIENYKNIFFLPDPVSEFIQVRLNICLDISILESFREVLFVGLMLFSQMLVLRIMISWFLYINPYTIPWCYLAASVDWTEDILQGLLPSILGVNATSTFFITGIGAAADSLNHLVFTMPYLPSEAEEMKLLINQEMRDILVFHFLPINWYKHPIPNDLREFWYYERPDILESLLKDYKDVDIQFLPNNIVEELIKLKESNELDTLNQKSDIIITKVNNISDSLSTQILSNEHLFSSNDLTSYISENIHTFSTNCLNNVF